MAVLAAGALAQGPLERAVGLARERRYAEARKALEGAAEPAGIPQRIAFHRLKAAIASGLGDAPRAAEEMRLALALAPEDRGLLLATAAAELQAGLPDDALRHARAAGESAVAQGLIGDIEERRGDYVAAARAYQSAVALDPGHEQYRLALALELVEHHTFEPAILVLEQAAPLFPKSARIRVLLGLAQYALLHYEDAESALAEALAIDPSMEPAYGYLARIALEAPRVPEQPALDALCRNDAVVCAALQARAAGDRDDTASENKAAEKLKAAPPGNAVARCELGRIYQRQERLAEARTELEACVHLDPSPRNHYRLGLVYNRLGLEAEARREMALRNEEADRLSAEVARRETAVQAFEYLVK